jgi:hypothetical protein
MMTDKRFNVVVYGGGALLLVGALCLGFWLDGPLCVRNDESRVIGGKIRSVGGLFASETAYYLRYTGNKEGTMDECTFLKRTTADEYDRRMYQKDQP